ncbi:WGR domain protein [Leptospira weilii str. Ecochallenge]|uniref:WGR domain protein n=1 Tax=Leptospira weilii str. Ecochallenge TaxID=1049986 RepID=N1U7B5_9LEPT|nr:WGR domain protein [Leptospira weilii str. Ecochallenge]
MKHHLTYKDDKSDKFWNIEVSGESFTVTYGKTGTAGQTQTKTFGSEEECQKEAKKLLSEKLKKGYAEDGGGELLVGTLSETKSAANNRQNWESFSDNVVLRKALAQSFTHLKLSAPFADMLARILDRTVGVKLHQKTLSVEFENEEKKFIVSLSAEKLSPVSFGELCMGDTGTFEREMLENTSLAEKTAQIKVAISDYADWWLYHPTAKTDRKNPAICSISHAGGDVSDPYDHSAEEIFLRRLAEHLKIGDIPPLKKIQIHTPSTEIGVMDLDFKEGRFEIPGFPMEELKLWQDDIYVFAGCPYFAVDMTKFYQKFSARWQQKDVNNRWMLFSVSPDCRPIAFLDSNDDTTFDYNCLHNEGAKLILPKWFSEYENKSVIVIDFEDVSNPKMHSHKIEFKVENAPTDGVRWKHKNGFIYLTNGTNVYSVNLQTGHCKMFYKRQEHKDMFEDSGIGIQILGDQLYYHTDKRVVVYDITIAEEPKLIGKLKPKSYTPIYTNYSKSVLIDKENTIAFFPAKKRGLVLWNPATNKTSVHLNTIVNVKGINVVENELWFFTDDIDFPRIFCVKISDSPAAEIRSFRLPEKLKWDDIIGMSVGNDYVFVLLAQEGKFLYASRGE